MALSTMVKMNDPPLEKALLQEEEEEEGEEDGKALNLSLESQHLFDADDPFNLPPSIFCNVFRLPQDMVRYIVEVIEREDRTADFSDIPLARQVLTTLLVFATGEYQRWTGCEIVNGSNVNVNNIVRQVTMSISKHMLDWVNFPVSSEARGEMKKAFEMSDCPFPGAIGVMDNFHVRISTPSDEQWAFYSHTHKFHSLNVQMICGPDLKISFVNPRYPGGSHDNYIWQESAAYRNMCASYNGGERDTWILGDGNYAMQPWLMTPVPLSVVEPNSPQERYNAAHWQALLLAEKCVRALRGTWRILSLGKPIEQDPVTVANIVNVCCVLHNMRCVLNAPPILAAPKRRYKRVLKRRGRDSEGSFSGRTSPSAQSDREAPADQQVSYLDDEEQLRREAARIEAQIRDDFEEPPREILGNDAAAQNILANQSVSQNIFAYPNNIPVKLGEFPAYLRASRECATFSDAYTGSRRRKIALAKRIRERLIAQYFSQ